MWLETVRQVDELKKPNWHRYTGEVEREGTGEGEGRGRQKTGDVISRGSEVFSKTSTGFAVP